MNDYLRKNDLVFKQILSTVKEMYIKRSVSRICRYSQLPL